MQKDMKLAPIFIKNTTLSHHESSGAIEGQDYTYNESAQTAVWQKKAAWVWTNQWGIAVKDVVWA